MQHKMQHSSKKQTAYSLKVSGFLKCRWWDLNPLANLTFLGYTLTFLGFALTFLGFLIPLFFYVFPLKGYTMQHEMQHGKNTINFCILSPD